MNQKNLLISLSIFLLLFVFCIRPALAGQANLSWNPNPESDIAGYKIYYGTSSRTGENPKECGNCGYLEKIDIGNVTAYEIKDLKGGKTYYFSITSYDKSGNESGFSPEMKKSIEKENVFKAFFNWLKQVFKKLIGK